MIERKNGTYALSKDTRGVSIPGTIQDVIMARVDSLPEAARGVLQAGSAIEREFGHELIKRVTGLPEQELLSQLSALKDSELLYERGIYPQSSYIFRHALTREVVYNSILGARKKKLHVDIAAAIEDINKGNLEDYYGSLAEHYAAGEDYEKGAEYCRRAARTYEKAASMNDAIAYSEKRVACLESLQRSEDVEKQIIDARTTLGLYYMQLNQFTKARESVGPVVDLAVKRDYRRRIAQIYTVLGTYYYFIEDDLTKGVSHLEEAQKIGEELNDLVTIVLSGYWLAGFLSWNCEFDRALTILNRCLEINTWANNLWGMAAMKSNIAVLVYGLQGKLGLAYQMSKEAVQLADESGDIFPRTSVYWQHGANCLYKGYLDEAEAYLLKAVDYCERSNNFFFGAFGNLCLGMLYRIKGEYGKGQEYNYKAISLADQMRLGRGYYTGWAHIELALAKVLNNEKDVDLELLYAYASENKAKFLEGEKSRDIAEILLNIDDRYMSEAEDWIKKAIEADNNNGTMCELGMDHAVYAELLKRKGDLPGAREKLNKAIEIYRECGADGWLKKAQQGPGCHGEAGAQADPEGKDITRADK